MRAIVNVCVYCVGPLRACAVDNNTTVGGSGGDAVRSSISRGVTNVVDTCGDGTSRCVGET